MDTLHKYTTIFINTAPQVLFQLVCPWHISLHWSIAVIGYVLYLFFLFWLLSVLKIRKGALIIEHILILITILAAIGELWLAKLLDEPLLIVRHRKELNSQINRFKKRCPFSKLSFYITIETKIANGVSSIKKTYISCKILILEFPTRIKMLFMRLKEIIAKLADNIKKNTSKVLEYIRSKIGKF